MMASLSKTIVDRIIDDLNDRHALQETWENIDDDIQDEIRQEWEIIVEDTLSDWEDE